MVEERTRLQCIREETTDLPQVNWQTFSHNVRYTLNIRTSAWLYPQHVISFFPSDYFNIVDTEVYHLMMADVHRISEAVYHRVNKIIGCQQIVKMRRDSFDIIDIIANYVFRDTEVHMTSGSRREGFDMRGSDYDFMHWSPDVQVICKLSQVHLYTDTDSIILMEDQNTRPGFVLLKLLSQWRCIYTNQSLIHLHNEFYISSFMFCHAVQPHFSNLQNSTIHGPCTSGFLADAEFDYALCFKSKHWPPQAYTWIERSKRFHWPPPSVLQNVIQNGCHFMAIGAKNSPSELHEWRLSFSQAEQKLVYCMTHCQFLVYGLLKLFLKEVLNKGFPDYNKLLCSYFMKTVVFWEVQQNFIMQWNEQTFLSCFWSCYKCLMKWVYNEYCPNFFVPQNNMFYPKITGTRQQQLFSQMYGLYHEGFHCLLRSSSIHDQLYSALVNIQHPIINESLCSEFDLDFAFHSYARLKCEISGGKSVLIQLLTFLFSKLKSNISQTQRVIVYKHVIMICHHLAFLLQTNPTHGTNSEIYKHRKQGLKLMKLTTKLGSVSDVLYLALYHYNDGRYRHTLSLLHEAQYKLNRHYVMYNESINRNRSHYIQTMSGQSMTTKIKEAWVYDMQIPAFTHFPELRLELRVREQMGGPYLFVSPYALLHFLYFLCYYHLNCAQQEQSIHDLHTLVLWDDGTYIGKYYKDIAWTMLGISHQLSTHYHHALKCYWEAHRQSPIHEIQQAALYRMQTLARYT